MKRTLRVLCIEDSKRDFELLKRHLSRAGYSPISARVETREAMKDALEMREWDVILCDYAMPQFNALAALALLKEMGLDIPFIVISGTVGENVAVEAMRAGATDYLMKDNLVRLAPTLEREMQEAENRQARRRAEESLRKAEEKYRSIFENAVEGIFQSSLDGRFIAVNPAMARILGYESPEELIAHRTDIEMQHYVDPRCRPQLKRMLDEQGIVVGFECEVFRKDRRKIWTVENIRAIRDESGTVLFYEGSIEDVTGRKILEEQFRQSQKMEAVGQLAGGVAHDFNNLLTVILGYSQIVLRSLDEGDPLRSQIKEIEEAGMRAASLTSQLLAFSRGQVLQPSVLDLNAIVSDMNKMLRRLIGEAITLEANLEPELGQVKADSGQIEQVIMNLIVNARDAMQQGGRVSIETANVDLDSEYAIKHIGVAPGHYVMLAVSDSGCGMDKQTQARVFEPFFTTKEQNKGTGLGLSTVYGIVKQSGGNIWLYSEPGRGTTFKVYLPRVDEAPDVASTNGHNGQARGWETTLLVEDEEMVRKLAREVLQKNGYTVLEASNGGEALLICEQYQGPIHLMITDMVMPQMSGPQLVRRLAPLCPEIKVLYMSGYTDDTIMHAGLASHEAYLQKPFMPDNLLRKVREVLDHPRQT